MISQDKTSDPNCNITKKAKTLYVLKLHAQSREEAVRAVKSRNLFIHLLKMEGPPR